MSKYAQITYGEYKGMKKVSKETHDIGETYEMVGDISFGPNTQSKITNGFIPIDPNSIDTDDDGFDIINKPKHYNSHPSDIECIDIVKHHCFCIGNAIKYLWRQGLKDGESSVKDLKKAVYYINKKIEELESDGKQDRN